MAGAQTGAMAMTGLVGLAVRMREKHASHCLRVHRGIRKRLTERYGALAASPEHRMQLERAEMLMGSALQGCVLPLDQLASTAFEADGFSAAAERTILAALPFDPHEREGFVFEIASEAIREGLAAARASPEFEAALASEVTIRMAQEVGLIVRTSGEVHSRILSIEATVEATHVAWDELRPQIERLSRELASVHDDTAPIRQEQARSAEMQDKQTAELQQLKATRLSTRKSSLVAGL